MVIGFQWIIFIGIALVSWLVQMNLQNKFKKYSKIPTGNGNLFNGQHRITTAIHIAAIVIAGSYPRPSALPESCSR